VELDPDSIIDESLFRQLKKDKDLELLIIKTGFQKHRGSAEYIYKSPIVKASLSAYLKNKFPKLKAIGFDFISISSLMDRQEGRKAHKEFLKRDILIVEDMNLSKLLGTPESILVSPFFVSGADGAPASVWAMNRKDYFDRCSDLMFDFDGVILDSIDVKTQAFYQMYEKYGKQIATKAMKHHKANGGMSRYEKFKIYHKQFLDKDISKAQMAKLDRDFSEIIFNKLLKVEFIDGALDFLKLCKSKGKRCFLVSATPEAEIKKLVKQRKLAKFFTEIKGSPEAKAKNIAVLLNKYKIKSNDTVFFGDADNDLKAANANRVKFVPINYAKYPGSYKNFKKLIKDVYGES
jgi:phosphoglycolate phosphatase-like HAD superfamily hydrolase